MSSISPTTTTFPLFKGEGPSNDQKALDQFKEQINHLLKTDINEARFLVNKVASMLASPKGGLDTQLGQIGQIIENKILLRDLEGYLKNIQDKLAEKGEIDASKDARDAYANGLFNELASDSPRKEITELFKCTIAEYLSSCSRSAQMLFKDREDGKKLKAEWVSFNTVSEDFIKTYKEKAEEEWLAQTDGKKGELEPNLENLKAILEQNPAKNHSNKNVFARSVILFYQGMITSAEETLKSNTENFLISRNILNLYFEVVKDEKFYFGANDLAMVECLFRKKLEERNDAIDQIKREFGDGKLKEIYDLKTKKDIKKIGLEAGPSFAALAKLDTEEYQNLKV